MFYYTRLILLSQEQITQTFYLFYIHKAHKIAQKSTQTFYISAIDFCSEI